MNKEHHYNCSIAWTGNRGSGTNAYSAYDRSHSISVNNKITIEASSDPAFMGDGTKYNPEEFLLASLSSCHMLWYLHLCSDHGIVVTAYKDEASGTMLQTENGGHFTEVVLHPQVTVASEAMVKKADALHEDANRHCFIANSCKFPVKHKPECKAEE